MTLSILSLIFNLIGAIILANSLNKSISVINASLQAIEFSIESITTPKADIFVFRGFDKHRENAWKRSSKLNILGLSCVFVGIALQFYGFI